MGKSEVTEVSPWGCSSLQDSKGRTQWRSTQDNIGAIYACHIQGCVEIAGGGRGEVLPARLEVDKSPEGRET